MRTGVIPHHRFTVEEYYRLGDTGVLAPDARVELLDGLIYDMLPTGPFHSSVETRLLPFFFAAAGGRWLVRVQSPVHLDDGSEPIPDFALVKPRTDHYKEGHPQPPDVFLLVEIAQSSLPFDRKAKLVAYARAGVAEYWIVNLKARSVEVHREASPTGEYGRTSRHKTGSTVSPAAFPDLQIAVADLF